MKYRIEPKPEAAQHTPTPWRLVKRGNQRGLRSCVIDTGHLTGGAYCKMGSHELTAEDEANAAFIVQACNSYEALTAQCDQLIEAVAWAAREFRTLKDQCDEREWAEDWQTLPDCLKALEATLAQVQPAGGGR